MNFESLFINKQLENMNIDFLEECLALIKINLITEKGHSEREIDHLLINFTNDTVKLNKLSMLYFTGSDRFFVDEKGFKSCLKQLIFDKTGKNCDTYSYKMLMNTYADIIIDYLSNNEDDIINNFESINLPPPEQSVSYKKFYNDEDGNFICGPRVSSSSVEELKKKIEEEYSPENLKRLKLEKLLEKKAIEKFNTEMGYDVNTLSEVLNFLDVFPEHANVFESLKEDIY
jgi:hypothetical protein